jgi:hypothetical protein
MVGSLSLYESTFSSHLILASVSGTCTHLHTELFYLLHFGVDGLCNRLSITYTVFAQREDQLAE